jgi:WD40 repeat protein
MSRFIRSLPLVVALGAVAVAGSAEAGDGQPPAPQRRDLYGDALPDGAVARLGTVKLRAAGFHVTLTPDGRRLIGINDRFGIREWDAATGELITMRHLPGSPNPGAPYGKVYLSRDASRLASVQPQALEFWDMSAGARLRTTPRLAPTLSARGGAARPASLFGGSFAPDNLTFAAGEQSDTSRFALGLYDLRTGARRTLAEASATISDPVFSSDGKRIAVNVGKARNLVVRDVASGRELWHTAKTGDRPRWSPDGRWLVADEISGGLKLWDAETGRPAPFTPPPVRGGYCFSPDSRLLLVNANEDLICWDLAAGRTTQTIRGAGAPAAFAPDGRSIYTSTIGPVLGRWDIATGQSLFPDTRALGHILSVRELAVSPDGRFVLSASPYDNARLWDLATSRTVHTFPSKDISGVAFTPDSRGVLLKVGYRDIQLWDLGDKREVRRFSASDSIQAFQVTADGTGLVAWLGQWAFWDMRVGGQPQRTAPGPSRTELATITPDGRRAVESSGRVVDLATGDLLFALPTDDRIGLWFGISNDSKLAAAPVYDAATGRDGPLRKPRGVQVWDLTTGKALARIACGDIDRTRPAFSPDGRTLATCEDDGFRLWDVATGREVHRQPAHEYQRGVSLAFANTMAFAPDGRTLITAHQDGTLLVWDVAAAVRRQTQPSR